MYQQREQLPGSESMNGEVFYDRTFRTNLPFGIEINDKRIGTSTEQS